MTVLVKCIGHIGASLLFVFTILSCLDNTTKASSFDGHTNTCARSSCSGRPTTVRQGKVDTAIFFDRYNCFCDPECGTYGDCCDDITKHGALDENYRCESVPEIDGTPGVRLVVKCPPGWRDEYTRRQCENADATDAFLRILARGDVTKRNYRNRFCALCHGESAKMWRVEIRCLSTRYLNISHFTAWNQTDKCTVRFIPYNKGSYRPCIRSVDTCDRSNTDRNLAKMCGETQSSYVYRDNATYRNIYCARCNSLNATDISCSRPYERGRLDVSNPRPYPFAILMDMNTGTYRSRRKNLYSRPVRPTDRCGGGSIYDRFSGQCRRSWCKSDAGFVRGKCIPVSGRSSNETIDAATTANQTGNLSDCGWIKLNPGDKYVISGNRLYIGAMARNFDRSRYQAVGGEMFVCAKKGYNNGTDGANRGWRFSASQSYVTAAGLVISVIALTIHLAIYAILPPLRNVPGKNLMQLSAALLTANISFLVSPHLGFHFEMCVMISAITHLSFLLAFCWMNVMSFDIWYTFRASSMTINSRRGTSKRFMLYAGYAWCVSLTFVFAAIMTDFTNNDSIFKPMYGHGSRCWITNPLALVMFFAAPLSILLLSNVVFYVMTVSSIFRIDRSTKMAAQTNSDRQRCFLYIKLSVIMGLTWVFGFIAAFTDVEAIWYFFTVLNTLQGLFICVAFVFNRNVYRLLREKFRGIPYVETSSSLNTRSASLKGTPNSDHKERDSADMELRPEKKCDP